MSDPATEASPYEPTAASPVVHPSVATASPVRWIIVAIAGASAIAIGAFGAHGLESYLPTTGIDAETVQRRLAQFDTGARYHLAHAIVLLVLTAMPLRSSRSVRFAFGCFFAGIGFFSGSLYLLVLTNTPVLGAITPIGGVCWIVAWISLAFAPLGSPR